MSDLQLISASLEYMEFQGPNGIGALNIELIHVVGKLKIVLIGNSTQGNEINTTFVAEPEQVEEITIEGKVNPTKLFYLIVKVLKKTICPECNDGY